MGFVNNGLEGYSRSKVSIDKVSLRRGILYLNVSSAAQCNAMQCLQIRNTTCYISNETLIYLDQSFTVFSSVITLQVIAIVVEEFCLRLIADNVQII